MTLRLNEAQAAALRRKAETEHRSMQQVAQAAIDAYVRQSAPQRREAIPATEAIAMFSDLIPVDAAAHRADVDRVVDPAAYFTAYDRASELTGEAIQ